MNALSLINPSIPTLNPKTAAREAITTLLSYPIHEVPVVAEGLFLGFFQQIPKNMEVAAGATVEELLREKEAMIAPEAHFYDILRATAPLRIGSLAVCHANRKYIGAIGTRDLLRAMTRLSAAQSPGGLLIIPLRTQEYDLAQIVRLIEESGTKLLSLHVLQDPDKEDHIQLHIKTHTRNLERSAEALKRFGYMVRSPDTDTIDTDTRRNYDLLMRYLNP